MWLNSPKGNSCHISPMTVMVWMPWFRQVLPSDVDTRLTTRCTMLIQIGWWIRLPNPLLASKRIHLVNPLGLSTSSSSLQQGVMVRLRNRCTWVMVKAQRLIDSAVWWSTFYKLASIGSPFSSNPAEWYVLLAWVEAYFALILRHRPHCYRGFEFRQR